MTTEGRKSNEGRKPENGKPTAPARKAWTKASKSGAASGKPAVAAKPMRPAQCRKHLREALGREFPAIVDGFVTQAKKGSVQHFRAAKAMVEEFSAKPRRRKGPVQQLLEQLDTMDEATRAQLLEGVPDASPADVWLA